MIHLALSENELNQASAMRIANSLDSLSKLQVLELSNASLRSGSITIAEKLAQSQVRLTTLLISHNEIEHEGAIAFAEYFKKINSLQVLDMS